MWWWPSTTLMPQEPSIKDLAFRSVDATTIPGVPKTG